MYRDNSSTGVGGSVPSAVQKHIAQPAYRRDIDGLRAIAILSVVVFHGAPTVLPGGFVGVDVFFVISGFLITNIILRNLCDGTFSFKNFYASRIRRIYPALIATMVGCYFVGWFVLLPAEFAQLGKHMLASVFFGQNVQLWSEAGYFDTISEQKPLLHLWSLGIEEQFYLLFPVFLWMATRGRATGGAILLLGAASFFWCFRQTVPDPIGTFFLPHTRLWELTAGAALAYGYSVKPSGWMMRLSSGRGRSALSDILGCVGFAIILLAVFAGTKDRAFPGWWALLPVLGTSLMILAGPLARPNRILLGNPISVFVGKISYPLYLWHWPALAFVTIVEVGAPTAPVRAAAIASSVILAWLTYQFIERPIRFGAGLRVGATSLVALTMVLGFTGYVTLQQQGFTGRAIQQDYGRFLPDATHREFFQYLTANFYPCTPAPLLEKALLFEGVQRCFQSSPSPDNSIAIVGDSHGEHLFIGVAEHFRGRRNVVSYTYPCLPFMGVTGTKGCDEIKEAFDHILEDDRVRTVVLANYWLSPWREASMKAATDQSKSDLGDIIRITLDETLARLRTAGKNVYLVADIPTFPFDPAKCAPPRPFGSYRPEQCEMPVAEAKGEEVKYINILEDVSERYPNTHLIHADRLLCDDLVCSMRSSGSLLYRDNNHLSIRGAQVVGGAIGATIEGAGSIDAVDWR